MITPRATYRLQLNKDFTFADALALVPYLEELGVSHAYLSPILKAQSGSTHGYDTVDHTQLNPELGTMAEFRALADALHQRGMGVLLDFVPNHVGVGGSENPIWLDLLKHGQASRYAEWFDVDWSAGRPGATGKVLVPFLGSTYAEALAAGQIRLKADGDDGFAVWVYDNDKLPVRLEDVSALLSRHSSAEAAVAALTGTEGGDDSWDELDRLIANQHWRLVHFGAGGDEMNYRRFFVNSELAGIRIDRDEVFEHAHRLVFELIADGLVDGLRIDHIDGLLDPKRYLEQLQERSPRPIWLLIEKILAPHEQLRPDWPVDGTTGYEAGAELIRLVTRADAERALTETYAAFVGEVTEAAEEEYRTKLRVMDNELAAELESLARRFAALAWSVPATQDLTELQMRRVLRESVAHLSVYRTYADGEGVGPRDRREIGRAMALARRTQPQVQPMAFDFVERVLCGTIEGYDPEALRLARGRFQQYSGPVMAKGLEDTTLYRYNRLVSLNDVGAHPDRFSRSVAAFHDSNRRRLATHPHCMIATSTHDTKRGEDVRAFIAAIADEPELWREAVNRWRQFLLPAAGAVHANDLYLLLQLLVGGWPVDGDVDTFAQRLKDTMMKSLREARERSDWGVNNAVYEAQVFGLIDALLADAGFIADFHRVRERIQSVGRRKALVQAALKLTIPGVPDIYRGAEDWEQSFVDPDNRRPVDFAGLQQRLASPEMNRDEKIVLTRTLLRLRRRMPEVFSIGSYEPVDAGEDIIAFRRSHGAKSAVVVADLSGGHSATLPKLTDLPTAYGSAEGPVWVLASR